MTKKIKINAYHILCCTHCHGKLEKKGKNAYCNNCKLSFPCESGIFDFNRKNDELVEEYQAFQEKSDPYELKKSSRIIIEGHRRKMQILTTLFKKYKLENKTILDVGSGENIPEFLKQGKMIVVQDISKNVLKRSKKRIQKSITASTFIFTASNQEFPCISDSIDIIFAGEVIEHVKYPEKFINELYRVMKKGGKLVLTTPNRKAIIFRILGFEFSKHPQHISLQDYNSLISILNKRFKVRKISGFNQSFFHYMDRLMSNRSISKWWAKRFLNKPRYATNLIVECER